MDAFSESRLNELFDQKNFLEEINKRLELQVSKLQSKLDALEASTVDASGKLAAAHNENEDLRNELAACIAEKQRMENEYKIKTQVSRTVYTNMVTPATH